MSGAGSKDGSPKDDPSKEGRGRDERPKDDPVIEGAEADESGYPRDDYWRVKSPAEGAAPDEVPEPPQGYSFESPEEKADADGGTGQPDERQPGSGGNDSGKSERDETDRKRAAEEQGNAGGRDDARIVDD